VQETTSVTKLPILADVVATTRAVSLGKLTFDGTMLSGTSTLCSLDLDSSSNLVKMHLPPAFRRALPPVRTNARIAKKGDKTTFTQAAQTLVVGAQLARPESERLPSRKDDARISDPDNDGKPGVTVKVSGIVNGEIYLVQRSTSRLTGYKTSGGFEGRISFTNEQSILGASRSVLKRPTNAKPDPSRSRFRLYRARSGTSCAQAMRRAKDL
jgi:hypothetical protein